MLAPLLHAAIFADRVVLLDVAADRYHLVSGETAIALARCARGLPVSDPHLLDPLLGSGLPPVNAGGLALLSSLRIPLAGLPLSVSGGRRSIVRTAWWLLRARHNLRRLGLARCLEKVGRARRNADAKTSDASALVVAAGFERSRRFLPFRRACLPDSLALLTWLLAARIEATLVVGVRLDPFLAHAWVQTSSHVLNDDPDAVLPYTPILTL